MSPLDTVIAYNAIIDGMVERMGLMRVPGPILVKASDHINDMLTSGGPLSFSSGGEQIEVVQSLAKWKRLAIHRLGLEPGDGLYVDMHAIRMDEVIDPTHSHHVEQIDWEVHILPENRSIEYLRSVVVDIYDAILQVEDDVRHLHPEIDGPRLAPRIHFITKRSLDHLYPDMGEKEREDAIAKIHGSVCIIGIGAPYRSWEYDDWDLNADIIIWSHQLQRSVEISSMGIRVDAESMQKQASMVGAHIPSSDYHNGVMEATIPMTIGGGIGKARLAMVLMGKTDIRDVHPCI